MDDGCVIMDVDVLDREGGDLSNEDTAESIGNGCIDANQRKRCLERVISVKFNSEVLDGSK